MTDGSVVVGVNFNISQAEKKLAKLKQDIEKTESEIADATKKRDEAQQKSLFDTAELDREKAKLKEIKNRLRDIRDMSKDKSLDLETRESYAAQIPAVREELSDQQVRVNGLQAEWNKTENAVSRYNKKIADAEEKLDRQKDAAGELIQQIEAAEKAQSGMAGAIKQADVFMDRFTRRVKALAARALVFGLITSALRSLRGWMGKVVQTNSEARQSIARLKGALLTLAQPLVEVVIPAFTALVNILSSVVATVARFVPMLFGKTLKQSGEGAKKLYNEANAIGAVGAAADEAAGSLAGFDEINQISTETAKDAGGGAAGGEEITPDFSWMSGAGGVMGELLDLMERIAPLVGLIGAGFALWKIGGALPGILGTIATNLGLILVAIGGILLFWDGLKDAWENGVDWGNLIEMVLGLAAAAGALYLFLGPLAAGILLVVGGLAMLVTGFHDAMENGWNLQNTLLSIAGILGFGLGIALLTGSWIPLLIAGIAALLLAFTVATGHGEELLDGIRSIMEGFIDFFTGIFSGDIEKAIGGIEKIFAGLKTAVFAVIDGIKDTFLSFLTWLDEKTGGKFHGIIEVAKGFVTGFFESAKETLGNLLDAVKQIFTGITQFISGVFTGDWDLAWEGVKNIFKGAWNGIVSLLEGAVNLLIKGINWLISQLNKVNFDVPEWVPIVGGKSFGINIPKVSEIQIPRLAAGSVIPPNREFMAVLGDNKTETEVVSPLSTMKQAVLEALREAGGAGGGQPLHVNLVVDGKTLARVVVPQINDMTRQAGRPVLLY